MIVLGWFALMIAGFIVAAVSSMRAVRHARALAQGSRIPPFFIGITLLAIGTDLPEIANSIIASASGHGDLNAGDSIGSALTQGTLVLGLLPILTARFTIERRRVAAISISVLAALAVGALLIADGMLSRLDGFLLLTTWGLGSAFMWRHLSPSEPALAVPAGAKTRHATMALVYLSLVGLGAGGAVAAFVQLSVELGIPEYILSFFVASLGTSLPELFVDVTALRAGLKDMALGDVLGSCFVDATLSLGIGPLLFPTPVTRELALTGSGAAILAIALATLVLVNVKQHSWKSGVMLIAVYLTAYWVLLGG